MFYKKNNSNIRKSHGGQSVLEIIVAMAIFGLIVSSMTTMVLGGFDTMRQGGEQTEAEALAQEGIEAVRAVRNRDWDSLICANCVATSSGGVWSLVDGSSEVIGKYERFIRISDVYRDANKNIATFGDLDEYTKLIEVEVVWNVRDGVSNSVKRVEYMTNWWYSAGGECLFVYTDNACFDDTNNMKSLINVTFENICSESIVMVSVEPTWDNPKDIENVTIDTIEAWDWQCGWNCDPLGRQNSGVELGFGDNNIVIDAGATVVADKFEWNGGMSGSEIAFVFGFDDDTIAEVDSFLPPDCDSNNCASYCQSLGGYSTGSCRSNVNQCNNNDEVYEFGGDQYCTGGNSADTCCCLPLTDTTPPGNIVDLVLSDITKDSVELTWTASGDDGNTGTATSYDVRYSISEITQENWDTATQAIDEPTPSIAGSSESMTVDGLDPDTEYYFAIKSSDEVPNISGISNVVSGTTLPNKTFRVTEYYMDQGVFSGVTYDLILDQDLADDYFVIVQGSDGNGSNGGDRGPDENYIALTADPSGTGDLSSTGNSDVISFVRNSAVDSWVGVVTVVECLNDCEVSGFDLLGVERVTHSGSNILGSDASSVSWTDTDQAMLIGGFNGSGCNTSETNRVNNKVCHTRIWPSGNNTINWERNSIGASLSTAISTVMVIEWGSEWGVQRVEVVGNSGGNGADSINEYDTVAISPVVRENTWVWGTGIVNDQGIGNGAEGTLITLGDGFNQYTNESTVAVGQEYSDTRYFEVYALSHPDLVVDYRFKNDGNTGDLIYDVTTNTVLGNTSRMALVYNGCNGTGNAFPRSIFSARYLDDSTIRLERRRAGQAFPAWVQGVDFSIIEESESVIINDCPSYCQSLGSYSTGVCRQNTQKCSQNGEVYELGGDVYCVDAGSNACCCGI